MGSGMSDEPLQQVERQAAFWFAVLAVIAAALIFAFAVLVTTHLHNWEKVLEEHFAAIIGLPGAAAAAFVPRVIFLIAFCIRKVHCHAHCMK